MSDTHVDEWLDRYLDGELGERQRRQMDAHVASCAACSARVHGERHVRTHIASLARQGDIAPQALRDSVRAQVVPLARAAPAPVGESTRPSILQPTFRYPTLRVVRGFAVPWGRVAVGLATAAAVAVLLQTLGGRGVGTALAADLASDHGEHHGPSGDAYLHDEEDPERLMRWFAGQGLTVPLPATPPGARLVGGQVCLVDGRRVGHAVYRLGGAMVSFFLVPERAGVHGREDRSEDASGDPGASGGRVREAETREGSVGQVRYASWEEPTGEAFVMSSAGEEPIARFTSR